MSSVFFLLAMAMLFVAVVLAFVGMVRTKPSPDTRPWHLKTRFWMLGAGVLSGISLIVAVAVPRPTSAELDAARADEQHEVAQQKWEADSLPGEAPRMTEARTLETISKVASVTRKIMVKGSSDLACDALDELYNEVAIAELDDERQPYVDALQNDLGKAVDGCADGDWRDAMPSVLNSNSIAESYVTLFDR
ncbi:hypothetical protein J2Y69_002316 [Microbacterium resistens]|uniref:Uncharacterized protein n=1 Tax=Microbacterium resistens TaxID=156977 RepID=A0ABU1SFS6_9MICO|nr:hypothetical protein [Microbacterium resistens]MDR6867712.1 hypothetical protein [Microbacterium resistens]